MSSLFRNEDNRQSKSYNLKPYVTCKILRSTAKIHICVMNNLFKWPRFGDFESL